MMTTTTLTTVVWGARLYSPWWRWEHRRQRWSSEWLHDGARDKGRTVGPAFAEQHRVRPFAELLGLDATDWPVEEGGGSTLVVEDVVVVVVVVEVELVVVGSMSSNCRPVPELPDSPRSRPRC